MRVLLFALLLTGCGSACSSSSERLPKPSTAEQASKAAPSPPEPTAAQKEPPPPPPPPKPLDASDERVVYISPSDRTLVRFAAHGESLLVADAIDAVSTGERLSLQDMFGRIAWAHEYKRLDDLAMDDEAAFATADGHLYRYALDSGEPADLGEAEGQIVLTDDYVYTHRLGKVSRTARGSGKTEVIAEHAESGEGYFRIALGDGRLVMLVSAFRNRPARIAKLGWVLVAPEEGGKFEVRYSDIYSPGPQLHLDSGYAYFGASKESEEFEYVIMRVALADKSPAEVVVSHPIANFEVEGESIYAAAKIGEKAGLYRFSVGEGEPVLLSEFKGGATRIALEDKYLYWESRGRVFRIPR